jgi:hypothetical protein
MRKTSHQREAWKAMKPKPAQVHMEKCKTNVWIDVVFGLLPKTDFYGSDYQGEDRREPNKSRSKQGASKNLCDDVITEY